MQHLHSATLRIVDAAGEDLAPGSTVRSLASSREFPVGFDGRLFLTGAEKSSSYEASVPGGLCRFQIEWREAANDVPELGRVTCR